MKKTHNKDTIFEKECSLGSFQFNDAVVSVFDDMIERSIPGYWEIQKLIANVLNVFITYENAKIIDVGCSTGNTLDMINTILKYQKPKLIGVDTNKEMLKKAKNKFPTLNCEWVHSSLEEYNPHENDVVIFNLCLQFVQPDLRLAILKKYYEGLTQKGVLLLIEKIKPDTKNQVAFQRVYHEYKHKQGYSYEEISNKAKALEGVLCPFTENENEKMMREAGFVDINTFFCWAQFHGWVAHKKRIP